MNCNYQVIISDNLPAFYEEILLSFNELPARYNSDPYGKRFQFNNRKIEMKEGLSSKKEKFTKGSTVNLFNTDDDTSSPHCYANSWV